VGSQRTKVEFFPDNTPNQIIVYIEYPQGTDIEKTNQITKEIEMVEYDVSIIQKFANRLYRQARIVIFVFTIVGIGVGFYAGYVISEEIIPGVVGALLVGLIGLLLGSQRAFQLRLMAQTALCQAMIEQNTRPQ